MVKETSAKMKFGDLRERRDFEIIHKVYMNRYINITLNFLCLNYLILRHWILMFTSPFRIFLVIPIVGIPWWTMMTPWITVQGMVTQGPSSLSVSINKTRKHRPPYDNVKEPLSLHKDSIWLSYQTLCKNYIS